MVADGFDRVPNLDVPALVDPSSSVAARRAVAAQLGAACRESGFFYIVGHGIGAGLQERLEELSRRFFALPPEDKLAIRMALGGRAWRGYLLGKVGKVFPDLRAGVLS